MFLLPVPDEVAGSLVPVGTPVSALKVGDGIRVVRSRMSWGGPRSELGEFVRRVVRVTKTRVTDDAGEGWLMTGVLFGHAGTHHAMRMEPLTSENVQAALGEWRIESALLSLNVRDVDALLRSNVEAAVEFGDFMAGFRSKWLQGDGT